VPAGEVRAKCEYWTLEVGTARGFGGANLFFRLRIGLDSCRVRGVSEADIVETVAALC
jgi:hypothetical protein